MTTDDGTTCDACGATGQDGPFCDACGAPLPVTAGEPLPGNGETPGLPEASERARALLVPVADPVTPEAGQDAGPVLPGVPEPARPVARGPGIDTETVGTPCPWCSALNPLDRHFCRRCAMSLSGRPDPAQQPPWWRRLLGWRRREIPYAGQRPRLSRGPGRLVGWLSLAVIAIVAAFSANAWAGTAVTNVEDHFAHPKIVYPSRVTASREDPAHPVANLHDGFSNTWWGTGEQGDGTGTYVDATFAPPVNLLDIVITPGAGTEQDVFTSQWRPGTVKVTLVRADGSSTSSTVTLADSPGPATFAIHGQDIIRVRFTMESAYRASSGANTELAIAEIEFFDRP